MATIDMYVLEDKHGMELPGEDMYQDYEAAKDAAIRLHCRVVCYEYEFSDSYIVDDFVPSDYGPWYVDVYEIELDKRCRSDLTIWSPGGFK